MYASRVCCLYRQTSVCGQQASLSHTSLVRLMKHTAKHANRIQLPELYKLGILLKDPNDILGLHRDGELMGALLKRYHDVRAGATPFQVSLLDAVLTSSTLPSSSCSVSELAGGTTDMSRDGNAATAASSTLSSPVTAQDYYRAIMDLEREVEEEHGRANAREARQTAKKERLNQNRYSSSSHSNDRRGRREGRPKTKGGGGENSSTRSGFTKQEVPSSNSSNVPSLGETLGSTRAENLERYLSALEPVLRQLSPTETTRLIRVLAKLNYTNYEHTVLLTRRGCEVANHLQRHDLCTLYYNLHRLYTRDSLVAVVNRILEHVQELTAEEVYLLCQSVERQESTSTASQRLLTPLVAQAVKKLPDAVSSAYHRTLLVSMARYHVQQPATTQLILRDWVARWKTSSSEKDVLVLLEASTSLAAPGTEPEGLKELIDRLTFLAPTMDLWHVDHVMDLLSAVPMHLSTDCMRILLTRLENESGKLSVGQLKFVLHLLSTYPPAKGQVAVVSLAYACAVRATAMDAETLGSVLTSLATLQLFTDDFFTIAHVLQTQKGGMRSFAQVQALFDCCTAEMAALPQGLGMLTSVICTVAPALNDEELSHCRKALVKLGVTDREVLQKIFANAKRAQRAPANSSSSRKRRGGYHDPMADLL
ncbi:putative mitochondrial hypothetical protein [Leptomonas pyrrhocoris]|uniref:RNA-editing substrate-binding complex 8 protein HEAT repeats domain-containing protein n=1 Tax=Leptomonas pyrrhocoris TaxID=157538 RepID=A0A0N0DWB2_LEPPY|nr:putative mitochondrial hypothetical protein [Leptomonas pyrrhocoris]KPA81541.1 putative mitochondrial hypothetical protein [Leptomonas pyrrhocoris]|eukprot:XP_015659980.1 putative mitochondrial hypothetical protein [Leptomonas pyrrhocoris]